MVDTNWKKLCATITFISLVQIRKAFHFKLELSDSLINPGIRLENLINNGNNHIHDNNEVLSRHKRYTYIEPDSNLVQQFERHLTAIDGEKSPALQEVVDGLVKECDRLSKKALNESISKFADVNYMVHYNHTELVYRNYRQRYQDFAESIYHKLIFIMPHLVKKHMRTVFMNVTADMKIINNHCMNRFQELDDRVNTHFLSYGELFRSILIESYTDIEKSFYGIFTDDPKITLDGKGLSR